ncbi:MAG: type II secretion system minor pseudopilin GspJ [Pseudomonadota bacterium]
MIGKTETQRGFTLAETLVALFVLSLISAAGTSLLLGATSAGQQLRTQQADLREIDLAIAMIRNDIQALSVRAIQPDTGFGRPGNLFGRSSPSPEPVLSFVRDGWINPNGVDQRGTLQAVRYRLEEGKLIREAYVRVDASFGTPGTRRVLLSGVRGVETRFVRRGVASDEWIGDAGQPLHVLPDLISLSITFEGGQILTLSTLVGARE